MAGAIALIIAMIAIPVAVLMSGAVASAILHGSAPTDTVTITSPFAGLVVLGLEGEGMTAAKLPNVGQGVMADTPLLRLVEPRAFMVVVHVPEARAHWLRVGERHRISHK